MNNKEFDYKNIPVVFYINRGDKRKQNFLVTYNLIDVDSLEKVIEKSAELLEQYPDYDFEFRIEC